MRRVRECPWSAEDALTGLDSALSRSAQFWSSYSGYLREIRRLKRGAHVVICLMVATSPALLYIPKVD